MLPTSLGLALLAGAADPTPRIAPVDLLPADSMVVVEVGDLASLVAVEPEARQG